MKIYQKSDFKFSLPEEYIARFPLPERSAARMLVATVQSDTEVSMCHRHVYDLPDYLNANDLLVFNNTKVLPARLFGKKPSGGKIEILIERLQSPHIARAYIRASKAPKVGSHVIIGNEKITVKSRTEALFSLESQTLWQQLLSEQGEMPIPPYLDRQAHDSDKERYQTVYAKHPGAVAAPTAGLHFDGALLNAVKKKDIPTAEVTLHVGAGTFQPVRHEDLTQHTMHEEWLSVEQKVCDAVMACRQKGGRVIAVGTTSLRALETAGKNGDIMPYQGDTNLFITPGYTFKVTDGLFTNFHLPESTLLMLVSAFAGYDNIRKIYARAIAEKYRFFSYGDAMFIPKHL